MLDVFIDMTNTSKGNFGNDAGGRCAVGSILWELGIPHDRLLGHSDTTYLERSDRMMFQDRFPKAAGGHVIEDELEFTYDLMIDFLESGLFQDAYRKAKQLIYFGDLIGINFIIASPLPKQAPKPKELAHA